MFTRWLMRTFNVSSRSARLLRVDALALYRAQVFIVCDNCACVFNDGDEYIDHHHHHHHHHHRHASLVIATHDDALHFHFISSTTVYRAAKKFCQVTRATCKRCAVWSRRGQVKELYCGCRFLRRQHREDVGSLMWFVRFVVCVCRG